jgi:hypothetical protein
MSLLDFSFKEYHSFQFEALKFTRGDYFNTGHKQKKYLGQSSMLLSLTRMYLLLANAITAITTTLMKKRKCTKLSRPMN